MPEAGHDGSGHRLATELTSASAALRQVPQLHANDWNWRTDPVMYTSCSAFSS